MRQRTSICLQRAKVGVASTREGRVKDFRGDSRAGVQFDAQGRGPLGFGRSRGRARPRSAGQRSMSAGIGVGALRSAVLLAAGALCFPSALLSYSAGAPTGVSGGDFPGEENCTKCHRAEPNSGSGSISLLINGIAAGEYSYSPGETVPVVVRANDSDAVRFGFELTARSGDGCGKAGDFSAEGAVQIREGTCGGDSLNVQWATHRVAKVGTEVAFEMEWTAPPEDTGPVAFAVAVNAANGNLNVSGDNIYNLQTTVQPSEGPLGPPQISEGGVVLADLHSGSVRGAPGALATVLGTDFASASTKAWLAFDDQQRAVTIAGGVCLEVNGERSPLKYVSRERIDFQVPVGAGLGQATVKVIRDCGADDEARSEEASFEIAAVQPAFFLLSESPSAVAARHQDETPVGNKNLLPWIEASPAVPGEVVSLFGTGFGPVVPALATGELPLEDRSVSSMNVRVQIGGIEVPQADVLYVGAAPGFLGTNRVDVRIPQSAADGEHSVVLLVDDVASPPGPQLSVASPPSAPPGTACASDTVLMPGQQCSLSLDGLQASFAVDGTGKACITLAARNLKRCGDQTVGLPRYGASAEKNDDGNWTINLPPSSP